MQKNIIEENIFAFTDPNGRSSCGMISTEEGIVLVDATARPVDIQACLDMARVEPNDVCQVLITHSHSDHTSGIPLFDCPVLAHKLTHQHIKGRVTERSKTQIPTDTFEGNKNLNIGKVKIEMIHLGGHTPGSSVVWIPQERILFTGDLIFEGRYPFLATANIPRLIDALDWLPSLGARIIIPGHGEICGYAEVSNQLVYIIETWERTKEHLRQGHSLVETQSDTEYRRYSDRGYEKLHRWNIKVCYQQLKKANKSY